MNNVMEGHTTMDALKPLPADSHRLRRTVADKNIYLAAMTGVAEFNTPLFNEVERILYVHNANFVANPALYDVADGYDWEGCKGTEAELEAVGFNRHEAMKRNIRALVCCQMVVFLPGWRQSKGAYVEWEVARSVGLDLYEIVWSADPDQVPLHETFAKFGDILAQALHPAGIDLENLAELYQPAWSPEVAPVDPASLKMHWHHYSVAFLEGLPGRIAVTVDEIKGGGPKDRQLDALISRDHTVVGLGYSVPAQWNGGKLLIPLRTDTSRTQIVDAANIEVAEMPDVEVQINGDKLFVTSPHPIRFVVRP